MSPKAKLLLVISFCFNAVLLAAWFVNRSAPQQIADVVMTEKAASKPKKSARPERSIQTLITERERVLNWTSVESADYRDYIKNLRAIGCPEETVRDIIIADINSLYASKIAALFPSSKEVKFWRVEDRAAKNEERERDSKRRDLEREKGALIKELLGVDYDVELARLTGRPTEDDMRYGFLSPEKQEQIKAMREKYRNQERALFNDGGWTPENRAKFVAMRAEREAELAKVLSPEEFEQYQLRNSYTARNMRENLSGFQPNEDEFRQIFQSRKTFDDQFALTRDGGDEAYRTEKKAAEEKLNAQLKAVLGEDRFHDYELSQDERFRDIYDFAQRYDLPREKAETVYEVRIAAELERRRIQSDASLNAEARTAALQSLSQMTQTALGQTLGQQILPNYLSRSGEWLERIGSTGDSSGRRERDRDRDRDRRIGR